MPAAIDQPITLEQVVQFLATAPFFEGLDAFERGEVVRIMEVQRLQAGEEVFHEGSPGDAWHVIFEGKARVLKSSAKGPVETAQLGPGACFGEMAVLDGLPRSAAVVAAEPLTLFRFRKSQFEKLLSEGSLGAYKLVVAMARLLSKRHRELTHQLMDLTSDHGSKRPEPQLERFQVSE